VFKVEVKADASGDKNGCGSRVKSLEKDVCAGHEFERETVYGWNRRTPTAARSFADLSSASGLVELVGPEELYVRPGTRTGRWERRATRWSRGIRRMSTEGLVITKTKGRMGWEGEWQGGREEGDG
jgi:hypothetical protein